MLRVDVAVLREDLAHDACSAQPTVHFFLVQLELVQHRVVDRPLEGQVAYLGADDEGCAHRGPDELARFFEVLGVGLVVLGGDLQVDEVVVDGVGELAGFGLPCLRTAYSPGTAGST